MVTEVYTGERKWEELREGGRHGRERERERVCTELRPLIRREGGRLRERLQIITLQG